MIDKIVIFQKQKLKRYKFTQRIDIYFSFIGKFEIEKASFFLLRPKVAYAFGRDEKNKGLKLFKLIFERVYLLVKDQKTYNNFCNLIEAILAYHKAYGGKD